MALKDILVHLDNSPSCEARLDLAINLARLHGAHLTGLYVISHQYYTPRQTSGQADAAKAGALFAEKIEQAGIGSTWLAVDWEVVGVTLTEILTLHCYYTDLVVIGQPDPSEPNVVATAPELPERLALGSGRPVLVVPYAGTFPTAGERVMVAWRAGRESTRALSDAMPILEKAHHVTVVSASPEGNLDENESRVELDIRTHLARHDIAAVRETLMVNSKFPVGDLLLNHACDQKIDLLVMGTYSQNRRGTFILGPVTRHLLNHMTVPLLLSH